MRRLALLLVAILVIGACASNDSETTEDPTDSSTTTGTAGSTTIAVPASAETPAATGTLIDLPPDWTQFTGNAYVIGLPELWVDGRALFDDEELQDSVASELEDFDLGGFEDATADLLANAGADFVFNLERTTAAFSENLNVIQFPAGSADDLAMARELGPTQLEAAGATDVTAEVIELERFPAVFISYRLVDVGVAAGHQYWVATDDLVYVLTFSGGQDAEVDEWRQMVETFTPTS